MRIIRLAVTALLTSVFISNSPAQALPKPSFDCARARAPVEVAICSDDELASRDEEMANLYWTVYRHYAKASPLKDKTYPRDDQRKWLAKRLHVCWVPVKGQWSRPAANIACLKAMYMERITNLSDWLGLLTYNDSKNAEPTGECRVKEKTETGATISCNLALGEGMGRASMIVNHLETRSGGTTRSTTDIRVHIPGKSPVEQKINLEDAGLWVSSYDGSVSGIEFNDFNADGHTDFSIGGRLSEGSYYPPARPWLFDPVSRRFVYNEALSLIAAPELYDPRSRTIEFGKHSRTVASYWSGGELKYLGHNRVQWEGHYGTDYWRWQGDKPVWVFAIECGDKLDERQVLVDRAAAGESIIGVAPFRKKGPQTSACFLVY